MSRVRLHALLLIGATLPALLAASPMQCVAREPGSSRSSERAASTGQNAVPLLEHLSLDLRGQHLSSAERDDVRRRLARKDSLRKVYEEHLDRWLTPDVYESALGMFAPTGNAASTFVDSLQRYSEPGSTEPPLYFLPHTLPPDVLHPGPPCARSDATLVTPWWDTQKQLLVCNDSYRPDHVFDGVGFCGGQPEPTIPTPPRAGCGCGPLLLACLPGRDRPTLMFGLMNDARSEIMDSAKDLLARDRPFDELLTTTRTLQTGLVEFLYLRRELIKMISDRPYDARLEHDLLERLKTIDLSAPARWIERGPLYRGSGLFIATPAGTAGTPTYRVMMRNLLQEFLCVEFVGVNVDRDSILAAVGTQHANLRAFGVHESPMRNQVGCKGCHAPMDNGTAFLLGLTTPLFGSHPTGISVESQLYVNGADDLRGAGTGFGGLTALVTHQPEFPRCIASRLSESYLRRKLRVTGPEAAWFDGLVRDFDTHGRNLRRLVRAIYVSDAYTAPVRLGP